MSDLDFRAGVGFVAARTPAHDRLAKAIEDTFGIESKEREGYALTGPNDVIQLLLNSEYWGWVAFVMLPVANVFRDKLIEKFGEVVARATLRRLKERLGKKHRVIDREKAEEQIAKMVSALGSVDQLEYKIGIGMASPTAEGLDRNIVLPFSDPTLEKFANAAVAIAIISPAVESEIELAKKDGLTLDGWNAGFSELPEYRATLTFGRSESAERRQSIITINADGEAEVKRH